MKSVMEEASSIMKAITKAWERVGKPSEFSIKIFEKEEKNFLGMTTKTAKIGIFFKDVATTEKISKKSYTGTAYKKEKNIAMAEVSRHTKGAAWPHEAVQKTQIFIKQCLTHIGLPNVTFNTKVSRAYLEIRFSAPIITNHAKEKMFFKNLALLTMSVISRQWRHESKQLKIMLTR